jgi:hypothetical protein
VLTWRESDGQWKDYWKAPLFQGDYYGLCGAYSTCEVWVPFGLTASLKISLKNLFSNDSINPISFYFSTNPFYQWFKLLIFLLIL